MNHTTIHDCKLIDLRKISDPRGNLTVIEGNTDVPFRQNASIISMMYPVAKVVARMLTKNSIS